MERDIKTEKKSKRTGTPPNSFYTPIDNGSVMGMPLHPMIIGQPLRIKYFQQAIAHIKKHERVWFATGSEIMDAYERANPVG